MWRLRPVPARLDRNGVEFGKQSALAKEGVDFQRLPYGLERQVPLVALQVDQRSPGQSAEMARFELQASDSS